MHVMAWAGREEELFEAANRQYEAGQYDSALQKYLEIPGQGVESAALYFNIGNCYYKLGDLGRAVLYYERALRLDPGDDAIRENLSIAQLATVDRIEEEPDFIFLRLGRAYTHLFPESTQVVMLAVLYLLLMLGLTAWVLLRGRQGTVWVARSSLGIGFLLLLTALALAGRWWEERSRNEAVIVAASVEVMSAPGAQAVEVFSLHSGAKVTVDQLSGDWVEIVLPDRKSGWVPKSALEMI